MLKPENYSPELVQFILNHKYFWWWVPVDALPRLGLSSVVEGTLNYGDIPDIKRLFELVGIETVADVFFENTLNRQRINYFPQVMNFFNHYFYRYVPKYFNSTTTRIEQ